MYVLQPCFAFNDYIYLCLCLYTLPYLTVANDSIHSMPPGFIQPFKYWNLVIRFVLPHHYHIVITLLCKNSTDMFIIESPGSTDVCNLGATSWKTSLPLGGLLWAPPRTALMQCCSGLWACISLHWDFLGDGSVFHLLFYSQHLAQCTNICISCE